MSEMTERVERAIRTAHPLYRARAAIAAMREPTEAMCEASWQATRTTTAEDRMAHELASPRDSHCRKAKRRYHAMIDEALR